MAYNLPLREKLKLDVLQQLYFRRRIKIPVCTLKHCTSPMCTSEENQGKYVVENLQQGYVIKNLIQFK